MKQETYQYLKHMRDGTTKVITGIKRNKKPSGKGRDDEKVSRKA